MPSATAAITGGIQQCVGLCRIERIVGDVIGARPVSGWKKIIREPSLSAPDGVEDELAIDRHRDGLTHADVVKIWVAQVQVDVVDDGAGRGLDLETRIGAEGVNGVWFERVDCDVGRALLQFERAGGVVRNDDEAETRDRGFCLPAIFVALEDDVLVLLLRDELVSAGADGVPPEVFATAGGHDAERAVGEVPQQEWIGLFEMHHAGERVGRVDVIDLEE